MHRNAHSSPFVHHAKLAVPEVTAWCPGSCDSMQAHGTVLSCRVLYDHANRSKQVAFVQMETNQQAVRSIEALHGMQVRLAAP